MSEEYYTQKGKEIIIEILNSYRMLQILEILSNKNTLTYEMSKACNRAELDLMWYLNVKGIPMGYAEKVIKSIDEITAWINFSVNDFSNNDTNRFYLDRMSEQFNYLTWDANAFRQWVEGPKVIIDAGCSYTYFGHLLGISDQYCKYIGIDKRQIFSTDHKLQIQGIDESYFIQADVRTYFSQLRNGVHVVFMAEFLHCLSRKDAYILLTTIVKNCADLEVIAIIEPKVNSPLDHGFSSHLLRKCKGFRLTVAMLATFANNNGFGLEIREPSNMHNLYLIKIK